MDIVRIKNFIDEREPQELYRYGLLLLGVFIALLVLFFFIQYRVLSSLDERLARVNQSREEIRTVLKEHTLVKQQRAEVDAILEKDKDFRISHYFELMVKDLNLSSKMSKDTVIDTDLNNGYIESQLESSFKDIDMKQVTDLLFKIDQNPRVYTKELSLIKIPKASKLDVSLTIATLQPKVTS